MPGMKKRKRSVDESALTPEEQKRRQRQRDLRSVALELRAKGVKYSPHKHGNKKPTSSKKKKAASKTDTDAGTDRPHKPRRAPQVIVIPIYWNTKQQEKEAVIAAARRCVDGIAQAGIKVGLDTTNTHTPGSKFRYWEERGCKYRVELGPQDVHNVTAVLAICGTPGEVAEKHTLAAPDGIVARLTSLLGGSGSGDGASVEAHHSKAPVGGDEVVRVDGGEAKKKKKLKDGGDGEEKKKKIRSEGSAEGAEPKRKSKKTKEVGGEDEGPAAPTSVAPTPVAMNHWGGGDDAEDDFGIDLLAVQNPPKHTVHKRRR